MGGGNVGTSNISPEERQLKDRSKEAKSGKRALPVRLIVLASSYQRRGSFDRLSVCKMRPIAAFFQPKLWGKKSVDLHRSPQKYRELRMTTRPAHFRGALQGCCVSILIKTDCTVRRRGRRLIESVVDRLMQIRSSPHLS